MRQYSLGLAVVTLLCTLLSFSQMSFAQNASQITSPLDSSHRSVTADELLELALRVGVSNELRSIIRDGIQSWSAGSFEGLEKIVARLEAEEERLDKGGASIRRLDRLRLFRDALSGLSGRAKDTRSQLAVRESMGSIQGQVTDAGSGLPLDFEFVEVYDALGDYVDQDLTDSGNYSIDGLPPGIYFVLTDTQDHLDELYDNIPCPKGVCDFTSGTPVQVTQNSSTVGVDFALGNGGRIAGRVTDAGSGLPLRSEVLKISDALGNFVGLDLTDGNGHFLVGGLPTGTYYALVDADDHLDELYNDIPCPLTICGVTSGTPIPVTLGSDTVDIDFALDTGGRVVGSVSEQLTGLPLSFEFVDLFDPLGDQVGSGLTDSSGNYLIGGLPSGTYFATTDTFGDYFDELYDDIPCPDQECDPTTGTPISVSGASDTTGIDFVLSALGPSAVTRLTEHSGLIVPVVVDLTDSESRTTLFSIHNTTDSSLAIKISYHTSTVEEEPVRTDQMTLDPADTATFDVRSHLDGYATAGLDRLTGLVLVTEQGTSTAEDLLGDFFSVDSLNNFASGDKLIRASQLCNRQRIRFVDFGSGTELQVLMNEPQGAGTPSFTYTAYDESGAVVGNGDFFADEHLVFIDRAQLTGQAFGVLDVDFGNALGGSISAAFSAFGRFSVGLAGECVK